MAVAVANDATGSAERETLVRGPFVITPSVPVLAAPGDDFEAGVTIANNVEGSGPNAEIAVSVQTNEQLSTVTTPGSAGSGARARSSGGSSQTLVVGEGRE